jgi:hypothetical protein
MKARPPAPRRNAKPTGEIKSFADELAEQNAKLKKTEVNEGRRGGASIPGLDPNIPIED